MLDPLVHGTWYQNPLSLWGQAVLESVTEEPGLRRSLAWTALVGMI